MFIEKFITDPRHIEIQVLGDKHGNVIYLGERECSIQRRNQKVIEEAPSPLLDAATRKKMGEQAVALAKAVGYDSAGTVEFVAGQDKSFYFLEMNTRLQVEHPVTELITGIDLVEQMIRSAAGEKLLAQAERREAQRLGGGNPSLCRGPVPQFLPSTGRLTRYRPPAERSAGGVTLRNDTGVYEGGEISIYYDPMIAKLVTHAATREQAIEAQADALDAFVIDGIRHNIPFLAALMAHPRWRAGKLSTGFIAEEFPDGFHAIAPEGERAQVLASVAAAIDHVLGERKRRISGQMTGRSVTRESQRAVWLGDSEYRLEVKRENGTIEVRFPKSTSNCSRTGSRATCCGGEPSTARRPRCRCATFRTALRSPIAASRPKPMSIPSEAGYARLMPVKKAADTGKQVLCPMPGLVVSIAVTEGQEVKAGETVAVVEAMKMENVLRAEIDGTVKKINAKPGDSLAVDAVILEFA